MSRNRREGRYAGKFRGTHFRQTAGWVVRKNPRSLYACRELMTRTMENNA